MHGNRKGRNGHERMHLSRGNETGWRQRCMHWRAICIWMAMWRVESKMTGRYLRVWNWLRLVQWDRDADWHGWRRLATPGLMELHGERIYLAEEPFLSLGHVIELPLEPRDVLARLLRLGTQTFEVDQERLFTHPRRLFLCTVRFDLVAHKLDLDL